MQEEIDIVLTKIENGKAADLDKIPPEVLKTRKLDDTLLRYGYAVYEYITRTQ